MTVITATFDLAVDRVARALCEARLPNTMEAGHRRHGACPSCASEARLMLSPLDPQREEAP